MAEDFVVKKSKISGNGVFANREYKTGETICSFRGELCSLDEIIKRANEGREHPSDPLQVDTEEYLDLEEEYRNFNHSCEPNSFIRYRNELVALHDIKDGEEITFDYSATMDDNEEKVIRAGRKMWVGKCNCGSEKCRSVIDQFKTLPKHLKDYYLKSHLTSDFIAKKFSNLR